jgi:cytochrome c oxidase assembly protein subunit 15
LVMVATETLPLRSPARDRFSGFAFVALGINVFVVLWGALVRATGSGAGCGDHWPLCNGVVVPRAPAIQTVIEFTHRVTSGLALVFVVGLCVWCFLRFPRGRQVRWAAGLSVFFLFVEALLGAGLVLLRLVGANASAGRAVYLAAHLTNTLLLLAALTATAWMARAPERVFRWRGLHTTVRIALAAAIVVSVTGAIAALGDTLFPAASLSAGFQQDFSSASHILLRLRGLHPVLAIGSGIYFCWVSLRLLREPWITIAARNTAIAIMLLVCLQLFVGTLNIALLAPVWMQITHLFLADLVWVALVILGLETGWQKNSCAMSNSSPVIRL